MPGLDNRRMRRAGSRGFTLFEVLVALAISGLILGLLASVCGQFGQSAQRLSAFQREREAFASTSRVLHLVLANLPREMIPATSRSLEGAPTGLVATTLGPKILGLSTPTRFSLTSEVAPDSMQHSRIVLSWTDPRSQAVRREVVSTGVFGVALSYMSRDVDASWQPTWSKPVSDLRLVRMVIRVAEQRSFEDVVEIVPVLSQECVIDPLRGGCPAW